MYDLVTLTSTILEIFIERLLKAMHAWLYMYIKHEYIAITVVNVLPSNINLLETASETNHLWLVNLVFASLTYSQVLHQPYTEAQLIFFLPI